MKATAFSDGIEKHERKYYQVSNPRCIMTATRCPYCGHDHDDIDEEHSYSCDNCGLVFMIGTLSY